MGVAKGVGGGGRGWRVREKGRVSLNPINGYAVLQRRLFALLSFMKLVKRRGVDSFTPQLSPLVWSFGWLLLHLRCNVLNFPIFHLNIECRKFWGREKVLSED